MSISTLGEAYRAHWKVHVSCDGCDLRERVDMRALLWTRGNDMPLAMLSERLKCPRCGNRKIQVAYSAPTNHTPATADLVATAGRYRIEQLDVRGNVVETLKRDRFDAAEAAWRRQVSRHPAGRIVLRDGSRVVRQWPERGT